MFWLILVAGATAFGFQLIAWTRVNNLSFFPRLFSGWLLGSSLCGVILHATTMVIPLSLAHALALLASIVACSFLLKSRHSGHFITFEANPFFLAFLLFTAGAALRYCASLFRALPARGPASFAPIYATELAFVNSVLHGCNRRHALFFRNPLMSGQLFHGYAVPLLFAAACMALGASYADVSVVVGALNAVSTAYAFYAFAARYTKWPVVASLLFLFSGSWAGFVFFRAVNRRDIGNDLVHQFLPSHQSVWYQPFASLLAMSKSASYAIAMAQYAIFWGPSLLSGIFAALIPSVATSFAVFALMAGLPNTFTRVLPFAVSIVARLRPFIWCYKPLFREAEMRGTFFAPIVIWFIAIGPIFPVIFFFCWVLPKDRLKNYLFASLGPFLILQFLREGTDHFQNAIAITAAVFPFVVIFFTELLRRFTGWPADLEYQGSALFITTATIAFLLFGGFVCAHRITLSSVLQFQPDDLEIAHAVLQAVPPHAVVLVNPIVLHPLIFTGRQQFLADGALLWNAGLTVAHKFGEFDRLQAAGSKGDWASLGVQYVLEQPDAGFQIQAPTSQIFQNRAYRLATVADSTPIYSEHFRTD
jgi:hypothetical protein